MCVFALLGVGLVKNFDFDAIGGARVRKGLTALGTTLGASVVGMHYFVDTVNVASPIVRPLGAAFAPLKNHVETALA